MAILYHFGIIQKIVQGIAWVMTKTMRTSGPESLSAAANIFVGQTEAPLVVKPFLNQMSLSELMAVMTGGFATVAGGVLAAYARFGIDPGHLLAASVMSAPAALVVAKMMLPSSNPPGSFHGSLKMDRPDTSNILDAATAGASDGLKLAVNVGAMLLAFISLVAFANWGIGNLGDSVGWTGLSLQKLLGYLFYPLAWLMGADSTDLMKFGELLGLKIAVNEFVAFIELGNIQSQLSPRSATLATYALCGFANFSSIGIQIGGISGVAPNRRQDLAKNGLKAILGAAIASWLTACIAGILLP